MATVSVVSQNLRFDGDFRRLSVFFSSPNRNLVDLLLSKVPSSIATLRGTNKQPDEAHTAILRRLVGRILVRRPAPTALLPKPVGYGWVCAKP